MGSWNRSEVLIAHHARDPQKLRADRQPRAAGGVEVDDDTHRLLLHDEPDDPAGATERLALADRENRPLLELAQEIPPLPELVVPDEQNLARARGRRLAKH